jgi:uracil-DNA glycosylase
MSALELLAAARSALAFQCELADNLLPALLPVSFSADVSPKAGAGNGGANSDVPAGRATPPDALLSQPEQRLEDAFFGVESLVPDGHPVRDIGSLEELSAWVAATPLLPIDEQRTNAVLGVGNPSADLMIVGEAPGADEDRLGEPFVGRAGKLLDKILAAIGFDRSDVYITNILKSRPPNNRDPLSEEVAAHIPILYRQIDLIRPKLILCVGKQAGCNLLGRQTSLGALRGEFHDFHGIPLLVTYHPAALLRNPNWKPATWEDVQLLRKRYDEIMSQPPPETRSSLDV